MTGYIILGVLFIIFAVIGGILIGSFLADNKNDINGAAVFGFSIITLITMTLAVMCLLTAGRAKIETHEAAKPAYLIREIERDGHMAKDTTYIYSFEL